MRYEVDFLLPLKLQKISYYFGLCWKILLSNQFAGFSTFDLFDLLILIPGVNCYIVLVFFFFANIRRPKFCRLVSISKSVQKKQGYVIFCCKNLILINGFQANLQCFLLIELLHSKKFHICWFSLFCLKANAYMPRQCTGDLFFQNCVAVFSEKSPSLKRNSTLNCNLFYC